MTVRLRTSGRFTLLLSLLACLTLSNGDVLYAQAARGASTTRPAAERPNILLITTDGQSPGFTGFEGNGRMKTPHLDRLASTAAHFTRCYVPTPQSAPSRAGLLTGQYPHVHGVTTDGELLDERAEVLTERLRQAGYACGFIGHWGLTKGAAPGFGIDAYVATNDLPAGDWLDTPVRVNGREAKAGKYLTDWQGDRAVEALGELRGGSFFLWVAFDAPREPFAYPPGLESLYPPREIEVKRPTPEQQKQMDWPSLLAESPAVKRSRDMNMDEIRAARSRYMAAITRVDENVGRILARLEELGLADRTVVVYTSLRGSALGEHNLFGDGPIFFEELIRVPLLIRIPGQTDGSRVSRVVSNVDLAATFYQLAGLRKPFGLQSQSLLELLGPTRALRRGDEAFLEYVSCPGYGAAEATPAVSAPPAAGAAPAAAAANEPRGPRGTSLRSLRRPGQTPTPATPSPAGTTPAATQPAATAPAGPAASTAVTSTAPAGPGATTQPTTLATTSAPSLTTLAAASAPADVPATAPAPAEPAAPQPPPPYLARVRGIVTGNFKLIVYVDQHAELLYDLQRDPEEMAGMSVGVGRSVEPQYRQVLQVLRNRLSNWRQATRDPVTPDK